MNGNQSFQKARAPARQDGPTSTAAERLAKTGATDPGLTEKELGAGLTTKQSRRQLRQTLIELIQMGYVTVEDRRTPGRPNRPPVFRATDRLLTGGEPAPHDNGKPGK